jgi:hypothetical protein
MRKLLLLALVIGLTACETRRGSLFSPAPSVVGTYTLRTLDDKGLPIPISTAGTVTRSLTSDTLALKSDNTLRQSTVYTTTDASSTAAPAVSSVLAGGSYALSGTSITLSVGSTAILGTYSGGTLTLKIGNSTYVYQR